MKKYLYDILRPTLESSKIVKTNLKHPESSTECNSDVYRDFLERPISPKDLGETSGEGVDGL